MDEVERLVAKRRHVWNREERTESRRLWAAVLLALQVDTLDSILSGRPVMASRLDAVILRRALRGGELPPPNTWISVDASMLDAVAEAGPIGSGRP